MSELTNIHARAVKDLTTPTELPVDPDALDQVKLVAGNFPAEYAGNEAMTVGMIKDLAAQGREAELEEVLQKITQEETRAKEVERLLIQNKAEKTYVDSELAAQNTKVNNHLASQTQTVNNQLSNQTQDVNTALSQLSTAANKFYPTLALANANIASLAVNQPVTIGEVANGGLWYKETAGATSLTKSPYDPLTQSKEYVNIRMILSESQGAFELVDANGRFAIYIKKDGTIFTKHGDLTVVQSFIKQNQSALLKLLTYDLTNSAMLSQLATNRSKDYLQLTSGDRFVLRILNDASLQVGNLNLTRSIQALQSAVSDLQSQGLQNKWITPNKNLVAVGDSLTAYAHEWFANLNTYLTDKDRTYTNHAVGGDKSTQQALKFGAGNYLLTLENQKINASGSTNITGTFVRYADKSIVLDTMLSSQSARTIMGSIAGVEGTINATFSGTTPLTVTFTPTTAPSIDVPVYDYTPFIPASLEVDKFKTFAIAIGRNNLSQPERIKQDILAMIDAQATVEKRFFVITPPSKAYSAANRDSAEIMENIFDIERWAMENFGERAIISRQILMRHGDGSATDNLDIANNCVPTSCTEDGLHWTATANTYIAQEVAKLINSKGW